MMYKNQMIIFRLQSHHYPKSFIETVYVKDFDDKPYLNLLRKLKLGVSLSESVA